MTHDDTPRLLQEAIAQPLKHAADLSKLPLAINPATTLTALDTGIAPLGERLRQRASLAAQALKMRVACRTDALATVQLAAPSAYRLGAPASEPIDPDPIKQGPTEVAAHLSAQQARARDLLALLPGLRREGALALGLGLLLLAISVFGVAQPLLVKALGENGSWQTLGPLTWALILGGSLALAVGAVNLTFFRARTARLRAWPGWLVMLALGLLAARYIASAMNADFLLMLDLPQAAQTAIRLIEAIGLGLSLLLVELGAGHALALAWLRWQQAHDERMLRELLGETEAWMAERAELARSLEAAGQPPDPQALREQAVQLLVAAVDDALTPHRETLRRADACIDLCWAGSTLEHLDVAWLRTQLAACERARDELLRLASPPADANAENAENAMSAPALTPFPN